jgi:hypothetical protein
MNYTARQKKAKSYYLKSNFNRKEIAEKVPCTAKTLSAWITKYGWDVEKETQSITRASLLKDSYAQLKAINEEIVENHNGVPNKALSDAKSTIRKEIEALSNNPLHVYVEVFTEFMDYVQQNHGSAMMDLLELSDEFINHLANEKDV